MANSQPRCAAYFKAKVAAEAAAGRVTSAQLAARYHLDPVVVEGWRAEMDAATARLLRRSGDDVWASPPAPSPQPECTR